MIRFDPRSAVVFAAALASASACIGALMWWEGPAQAYAAVALKEAPSVTRAADGHYWAEATVEGRPMRMLVDTGASAVALTSDDAKRLGFDPARLNYAYKVMTANGEAHAAAVKLASVSIAGAKVADVDALVLDKGLDASLLGMTYLGRLSRFEATRSALILRP